MPQLLRASVVGTEVNWLRMAAASCVQTTSKELSHYLALMRGLIALPAKI